VKQEVFTEYGSYLCDIISEDELEERIS